MPNILNPTISVQEDAQVIEATYPSLPLVLSPNVEVELARFPASKITPNKKYRMYFNAQYSQSGGGANTRTPIQIVVNDDNGTLFSFIIYIFNEVDRFLPLPACTALKYDFNGDAVVKITNKTTGSTTISITDIRAVIE